MIEVYTDSTARTISFIDNGKGMDKQGIEDFLSTIGPFGNRRGRSGLAEENRHYRE